MHERTKERGSWLNGENQRRHPVKCENENNHSEGNNISKITMRTVEFSWNEITPVSRWSRVRPSNVVNLKALLRHAWLISAFHFLLSSYLCSVPFFFHFLSALQEGLKCRMSVCLSVRPSMCMYVRMWRGISGFPFSVVDMKTTRWQPKAFGTFRKRAITLCKAEHFHTDLHATHLSVLVSNRVKINTEKRVPLVGITWSWTQEDLFLMLKWNPTQIGWLPLCFGHFERPKKLPPKSLLIQFTSNGSSWQGRWVLGKGGNKGR